MKGRARGMHDVLDSPALFERRGQGRAVTQENVASALNKLFALKNSDFRFLICINKIKRSFN